MTNFAFDAKFIYEFCLTAAKQIKISHPFFPGNYEWIIEGLQRKMGNDMESNGFWFRISLEILWSS